MRVQNDIRLAVALIIGVFVSTQNSTAEELSISGRIMANGKSVKGLPIVIQNEVNTWILSSNSDGMFSADIHSSKLKGGKYNILVPNAKQTAGTFELVPHQSPWFAPWATHGYRVVISDNDSGGSETIKSDVEVMGIGNISSVTLDVEISTK